MKKTIQEAVAEKISQSGQYVTDTVIERLAEVEITRRVEIITKAIQLQEELEKNFKKINKCDIVTYVEDKPSEAMSKERFDEIKKKKENIEKLTKEIDAALTQNSLDAYNKLSETSKKLENVGGDKAKSSGDGKQ